jgi:hypothetical protein
MPSTRRRTTAYSIVASLCVAQVAFAVLISSRGCDWTLPLYVTAGIVVTVTLLTLPYAMRRGFARNNRTPTALGFGMVGLFFWLVGWMVAFSDQSCGAL